MSIPVVPILAGAAVLAYGPTRRRAFSVTKAVAETCVSFAAAAAAGVVEVTRAAVTGTA